MIPYYEKQIKLHKEVLMEERAKPIDAQDPEAIVRVEAIINNYQQAMSNVQY